MANRGERIKSIISKNIKEICEFELKNESIDFFTITDIDVSDDYSYAKVFVSFFQNKQNNIDRLNRAKGYVRSSLAKKMDTRRVPQINFILDDSMEKQQEFESFIERIKNK
ncbi:MAG: 30S ribosome-binding factor RbfA [Bacillales bacterium]